MIIEVNNLSKSFQQGTTTIHAVDSVNLQMAKGTSLSIVGPSGSGKTTLLSLLAGLDNPTSGSVKLAGQELMSLSEKKLTQFRAKNIGIVFQQFHLMPYLTALENVSLPLDILGEANAEDRAMQWLKKVGLENRADHLPHQLSGGESQRVAIARASVIKPQILFADEPSGNLDTETGQTVMDLLFDLIEQEGMSMVLVTHDSQLAARCQKQVKIVGGHLQ